MKYGLVFVEGNDVFLGEYDQDLAIKYFSVLTDDNEDYAVLKKNEFSFVEIQEENDRIWLKDLQVIVLSDPSEEDFSVHTYLSDLQFPSKIADEQFMGMYLLVNKDKLN